MKKISCLTLLIIYGLACLSQEKKEKVNNDLYRNSKDTVGIVRHTDRPADYPGGTEAWLRYLLKNLDGHQALAEMRRKRVQEQTAVVQFVVCANGTICKVQVVNKVLPYAEREALRVIKKAGKWTPAQKDGMEVKSFKQQTITFINEY